MNKIYFLIVLFIFVESAQAQMYAVHFKDKNGTPYSLDNPSEFLSEKALERRAKFNIPLTEDDLPVNPDYITQIETAGAPVLLSSKWINCVVAQILDEEMLNNIQTFDFVDTIFFIKPAKPATSPQKTKSLYVAKERKNSPPVRSSIYGYGEEQIKQLNGIPLHDLGYQGQNILIAILDAGFPNVDQINAFSHLLDPGRIVMTKDFVEPGRNIFDAEVSDHGTAVLSCIAAYVPETLVGTAPEANFCLFRTEDAETEYPIEEYSWAAGAEVADSIGADLINSSLGYSLFDDPSMNHTYNDIDGKTIVSSIAATKAVERGIFVCISAGNSGSDPEWPWINSPADAEEVLTVGAVNHSGKYVSFSSIGPNAAGNTKPNTMARGSDCPVIIDNEYIYSASGTSFSSPITAGMVACLLQMFPNEAPAELQLKIEQSANLYQNPTSKMGYGIPDFAAAAGLVSIEEITSQYSVFSPNPTSGVIWISTDNLTKQIKLFDLSGRCVWTQNIAEKETYIDISSLQNGAYILHLLDENGLTISQKIIKI